MRKVDNLLDDEAITVEEKKQFIHNQFELIISLNKINYFSPNSEHEAFLFHFYSYAIENRKPQVINEIKNMLEAMRMDVYRLERGGIFSKDELTNYINYSSSAMFGLVHSFMFPDQNYENKYNNIGTFLWYGGSLRDILNDLETGYINLSREDIISYDLNVKNIKSDKNLSKWLNDKISWLYDSLNMELNVLKKLPLKIRVFWALAYPFYLHKIIRIQKYNYSLDYETRKNILKEISSVSSTIGKTLKIFQRVFTTSKIEKQIHP